MFNKDEKYVSITRNRYKAIMIISDILGLNMSENSSQQSARLLKPRSFGQFLLPHTSPGRQSESSVQSPSFSAHRCSGVQHPSR